MLIPAQGSYRRVVRFFQGNCTDNLTNFLHSSVRKCLLVAACYSFSHHQLISLHTLPFEGWKENADCQFSEHIREFQPRFSSSFILHLQLLPLLFISPFSSTCPKSKCIFFHTLFWIISLPIAVLQPICRLCFQINFSFFPCFFMFCS